MSTGSRKHQKSRPSKRFCEEKFACNGVHTEATFNCEECGTRQCSACDAKLHEFSKFRYHERKRIEVPPVHLLCQNIVCPERNYADLSCDECKLNICFFCDSKLHLGRKRNHRRTPYKPPPPPPQTLSPNENIPVGLDILTSAADSTKQGNSLRRRGNSGGINTTSGGPTTTATRTPGHPDRTLQSPHTRGSYVDHPSDSHTLGTSVTDNSFVSCSPPLYLANLKDATALKLNLPVGLNAAVLDLGAPKENTIPGHLGTTSNTRSKHPGVAELIAAAAEEELCDPSPDLHKDICVAGPSTGTAGLKPEHSEPVSSFPPEGYSVDCSEIETSSSEFKSLYESDDFKSVITNLEDNFASVAETAEPEERNQTALDTTSHHNANPDASCERELQRVLPSDINLTNCVEVEESATPSPEFQHLEDAQSEHSMSSVPDVAQAAHDSLEGMTGLWMSNMSKEYEGYKSFPIVNEQEELQVESEKDFLERLGVSTDTDVKVVSIFGNTGDGKSHTLNHTFFGGQEVFQTCPSQASCTIGVWCAYSKENNAIIVDTEGMLGSTSNANQRTRLLLKVLAVSDVVIYRTKAERLHADMFKFLGDASDSYMKHFSKELCAAMKRCNLGDGQLSRLGPSVIIFHETNHTDVLGAGAQGQEYKTAVHRKLTSYFSKTKCKTDAFCAVNYVGTKTVPGETTNFNGLRKEVLHELENTSVRAPRSARVIFGALKVLNDKFNGEIGNTLQSTFPDEYFTCQAICLSCGARCTKSMNHAKEDADHNAGAEKSCVFTAKYNNTVYTCKECHMAGHGNRIVIPKTATASDGTWVGLAKFAWSGYILECPKHGVIYQSRRYWYGNEEPEKEAVRTEIRHVWPGGNMVLQSSHNAGRKLLDGVGYLSDTLSGVSAKPTKMLSAWMADQIAPTYWVPNAEIIKCGKCESVFEPTETKHHCRACGKGFCDACSLKKKPVPERGWGETPVRVCDGCFAGDGNQDGEDPQITARKVGETIANTVGFVASVMEYPRDFIKDSARPDYWEPDSEITCCCVCDEGFDSKMSKHHCRSCGKGVCRECSQARRKVPSRGWDEPVRVCNTCGKKKGDL